MPANWPPVGTLSLALLLIVWGFLTALSLAPPGTHLVIGLWALATGVLLLAGR